MLFQLAESGAFEVTEVLCIVLRRIRLSLRDWRGIDHRERDSEHRQRRRMGWKRLEGTSEHVDRETRAHYRLDRYVLLGSRTRERIPNFTAMHFSGLIRPVANFSDDITSIEDIPTETILLGFLGCIVKLRTT